MNIELVGMEVGKISGRGKHDQNAFYEKYLKIIIKIKLFPLNNNEK